MSDVVRLRADRLEWREVEGEIVALDTAASEYLAVNRTGAVLWPLLAAGTTREALASALAGSFDVAPEAAAGDVDRFLAELEARGLLEG